jgi:hypothetical protein
MSQLPWNDRPPRPPREWDLSHSEDSRRFLERRGHSALAQRESQLLIKALISIVPFHSIHD